MPQVNEYTDIFWSDVFCICADSHEHSLFANAISREISCTALLFSELSLIHNISPCSKVYKGVITSVPTHGFSLNFVY